MNPDLILEKTIQLNLSSDVVTKRRVRAIKRSRWPSSPRKQVILASAVCALTATLGQAEPLDPTAFTSLGPSPFVSGTYQVDTSFDNPAPTIKQGVSVIATGIFYDPTPGDPDNRDQIAVFTFDAIDLPAGVTLEGLRNANSRPVALLSKDAMTVSGLIDLSGGSGGGPQTNSGGSGGAAGPGGGGGGGGGGGTFDETVPGKGGTGGVGFVSGYSGKTGTRSGGDGGSVELGGGGLGAEDGGGGAFGGNGGDSFGSPYGGTAYGDLKVKLEAGSGGGGSEWISAGMLGLGGSGGGGGGGAVELGAVSMLSFDGRVTTQGGAGGPGVGAGGGAGGGIILHADSVVIDSAGSVDASGGAGTWDSGGGGGGRVLIVAKTIVTSDLVTAINVTGGGSDDASPGSDGVLTTNGMLNSVPQITCPQSSVPCAPVTGMFLELFVYVSDPDPGQTLTLTLKEGSTILDTRSATTPANNLLVGFGSVELSAASHALTVEVTDGFVTSSCTTSITVEADTESPNPDAASLPTITGQCSASVSTVPTATDACAGKINGTTTDPRSYNTQGVFTVQWTYDDGHGNTTVQTQAVVVQDTLAPTITGCPPNQSANATNPTGAVVNYPAATASDNCGSAILSYSQDAGTSFPIGDTKVTVTATDGVGHQVTCPFNVHVKGAAEQLSDLVTYLASLSIDSGTKVSLQAKLTAAQSYLAAGNLQNALTALQDFINATSAVKGKKLSAAQANRLISDATRIRAVIGG